MSALPNLPPTHRPSQDRTNVQGGVSRSASVARGLTIRGNPPAVSAKAGPRARAAEQPGVWGAWTFSRVAPGSSGSNRGLEPGARGGLHRDVSGGLTSVAPAPPPARGRVPAHVRHIPAHSGCLGGLWAGVRSSRTYVRPADRDVRLWGVAPPCRATLTPPWISKKNGVAPGWRTRLVPGGAPPRHVGRVGGAQ